MASLALGSVQFGLRYGIANRDGQTPQQEIGAILGFARQSGMDLVDTAIAYGDSEARLGLAGVGDFKVVTKLPPMPTGEIDVATWVDEQIAGSLSRLGIRRLEGVLLHRSRDLLGDKGRALGAALDRLVESGRVRSAGVSIYDPGELADLEAVWKPGLVQSPCSVLDRRLERSGWLARLADRGIRVHVRSVFLQGLLLMSPAERPKAFDRWSGTLDRWTALSAGTGVPPARLALGYALSLPGVEYVVVGVESVSQLRELVADSNRTLPEIPSDLFSDDRDLLEPSRWSTS